MAEADQAEERFARARALMQQSRRSLVEAHALLRGLSSVVTNARARGALHQQIWECERFAGRRAEFFSQAGQDAFLDERVFKGKRDGTFVEIGGYDGITGSNCLFFELMRGWKGIVIEPSPIYHAKCTAFRKSACLKLAVGAQDGLAEFMEIQDGMRQMSGLIDSYDPELLTRVEADPRHKAERITVKVQTLDRLLSSNFLKEIDFISLDVEGAEYDVLRVFPFEKYKITAWTIENNSGDRKVPELMRTKGFKRIEAIGVDDIYLYEPD